MFVTHRKNDAVITVCQDNSRRTISVLTVNLAAEELLGYTPAEMVGAALIKLLPDRIVRDLEEYVEYEDGWNDIGNVLRRVRDFALLRKNRDVLPLSLRVIRAEPHEGHSVYQLIMRDGRNEAQEKAFRNMLRENFKGHEVLDANLQLPDRGSMLKDLELVRYHVGKDISGACFALVEVDDYRGLVDKQGQDTAHACLRAIATLCKQKLRVDDTIGCLSASQLGLILIDINQESARIVLNRLRWLIASSPLSLPEGKLVAVNISIGFSPVKSDMTEHELLDHCQQSLEKARGNGGNLIIEAN